MPLCQTFVGDFPDGFFRVVGAGDSGVVDEDIDAAEMGDGAVDEGVDLGGVGDVRRDGEGPMPRGMYVVHSLLEGSGPSACYNDRSAELAQPNGNLSSQPRTAARDQGHAS